MNSSRFNLLCVDETQNSEDVISWYFQHHHRAGDEVGIVHLYSLPGLNFLIDDDPDKATEAKLHMDAILLQVKGLKDKFNKSLQQKSVTPQIFFENASATDTHGKIICQIAEKKSASIIVMSQAGTKLSGSEDVPDVQVARYVSNSCTVPVIMIPYANKTALHDEPAVSAATYSSTPRYLSNNIPRAHAPQPMRNDFTSASTSHQYNRPADTMNGGGGGPMRGDGYGRPNSRFDPMGVTPNARFNHDAGFPQMGNLNGHSGGQPSPSADMQFNAAPPYTEAIPNTIKGPPYIVYFYWGSGIQEGMLYKMFAPYGKVAVMDIKHEKGFAFAHFYDYFEAQSAIAGLNGTPKEGTNMRLQVCFAQASKTTVKPPGHMTGPPFLVWCFAGQYMDKDIMYKMFGRFGKIIDCQPFPDKGYGFVHFADYGEALTAIKEMHGTFFADGGRPLQVHFKTAGRTGASAKKMQGSSEQKMENGGQNTQS